ncbi:MAG: tRNA uridine-5-carboxymethylaminomethyl(34) synthesis GTPase MnmE [Luteibaculaceae bacterium]
MIGFNQDDTICALSTPPGIGAVALVRITGSNTLPLINTFFSKKISEMHARKALFGNIIQPDGSILDEVLVTYLKGPNSYTGEDTVEVSLHGSTFIQQTFLNLLVDAGCRMATPGEYTMRAFLNGKLDLSQAEAVADVIESDSKAAHKLAFSQLRGGYSQQINLLREDLLNFASLLELELDFSEEDVEFADRTSLKNLLSKVIGLVKSLVDSFRTGNAIKSGIPVAILGKPNAGKSTLLNALLREERAIVSDIAGTTRDTIEDEMLLGGYRFRFIDTAGIRETEDTVENLGIERAFKKGIEASIVILVLDATQENAETASAKVEAVKSKISKQDTDLIIAINKADLVDKQWLLESFNSLNQPLYISAKNGENIALLEQRLLQKISKIEESGSPIIVTNMRHYQALGNALLSLEKAEEGLQSQITSDWIALDIRQAIHYLGSIVGVITEDDILGNIFGKFCIGK